MKFSLFLRFTVLSRKVKVAICTALFFALCFGGGALFKIPFPISQKPAPSVSGLYKKDRQPVADLKRNQWELLLLDKKFRKQLVAEIKNSLRLSAAPPVKPTVTIEEETDCAPLVTAGREAPSHRIASRGERPNSVIKGAASWYGGSDGLDGSATACGEIFDSNALTAAHRELPFGAKLRVTCLKTGKSVIVRVNDRGPYNYNLVLDLSRAAAEQIGLIRYGIAEVEIEILD